MLTQKQFYKTGPWKRARADYIARRKAIDGGVCEACGIDPGTIVPHYRIWLDDTNCNDPEVTLTPDTFKLECQTCHNREVDPRKPIPGRVRYGPDGEIIRNTDY